MHEVTETGSAPEHHQREEGEQQGEFGHRQRDMREQLFHAFKS